MTLHDASTPIRARSRRRAMALLVCGVAALGAQVTGAVAAPGAAAASRPARAALPAANFLVEWRLQAAEAAPSASRDVVVTSGSASVGNAPVFGPGTVVVGTARPAPPQGLRVANGQEATLSFDRAQTRTVYDLTWSGAGSQGQAGHEVTAHRVDGIRVKPTWSGGDTVSLDLDLRHGAPAAVTGSTVGDVQASRDLAFHSTVRARLDEWQAVARVGEGGEELQVRVSRR